MLSLLLTIGGSLALIAVAPRSLETFIPVIEDSLSASDNRYKVKINEAHLTWESWRQPLSVQIGRVEIRTSEGRIFSKLSGVSMGVNILSLLQGKFMPSTIILRRPAILLQQAPDKSLSIGFAQAEKVESEESSIPQPETQTPLVAILAEMSAPYGKGMLGNVRHIVIEDARMGINSEERGIFFRARRLNATLTRGSSSSRITLDFQMRYEQQRSAIQSEFVLRRDGKLSKGLINFANVVPANIAIALTENVNLAGLAFPVSGNVTFQTNEELVVQGGTYTLNLGRGALSHPKLDGKIALESGVLSGYFFAPGKGIKLDSGILKMEGLQLDLQGSAMLGEGMESIALSALLQHGSVDDLRKFWPLGISPVSREWITQNIRGGTVPKATCVLNIQPGDLQKPILPRESVEAHIELENTNIHYLPEHPELRAQTSAIKIDGITLRAEISKASLLKEAQITNGVLIIPDLNADNPRIELSFDAAASATEVAKALTFPILAHLQHLHLDPASISGSGQGHVALGFDFFAPVDAEGKPMDAPIDYNIHGQFKNATQEAFMKKFDIANATGEFTINAKTVEVNGEGKVNTVPMELEISYYSTPKDGFDTFAKFTTSAAPANALERFGGPALPDASGTLSASGTVKTGDSKTLLELDADLLNAGFSIKEFAWSKPVQKAGTLKLSYLEEGELKKVPQFTLDVDGFNATGSAEWKTSLEKDVTIDFSSLKTDNSDLAMKYGHRENGQMILSLKGRQFDATPFLESDGDNFSFSEFPAIDFTADLGTMILGEGRQIHGLEGHLLCNQRLCESAAIHLKTNDKPTHFSISRQSGGRELVLTSEDAGGLLKALDVHEGIEGGSMNLRGRYDDSQAAPMLNAQLKIDDYTVTNAPILGKMLTIASLTGMLDTLQGKGIFFKKLNVPFTLANDVITIKDAKTYGPAMGMTGEGTIRFPGTQIDMKGTIVPSYTLNSVFGKVPFFGQILTGGDGGGLLAARYDVNGKGAQADVSVNPLSMLTPGFLRGLFDIFDAPQEAAPMPIKEPR